VAIRPYPVIDRSAADARNAAGNADRFRISQSASVQSAERYAELYRRAGSQWITDILCSRKSMLALTPVGIEMPITDMYEGIAVADTES
jgi:hypothetical protein